MVLKLFIEVLLLHWYFWLSFQTILFHSRFCLAKTNPHHRHSKYNEAQLPGCAYEDIQVPSITEGKSPTSNFSGWEWGMQELMQWVQLFLFVWVWLQFAFVEILLSSIPRHSEHFSLSRTYQFHIHRALGVILL